MAQQLQRVLGEGSQRPSVEIRKVAIWWLWRDSSNKGRKTEGGRWVQGFKPGLDVEEIEDRFPSAWQLLTIKERRVEQFLTGIDALLPCCIIKHAHVSRPKGKELMRSTAYELCKLGQVT